MRTSTKNIFTTALLALVAAATGQAQAQPSSDQGRVISSTPIIALVPTANGQERRTVGYNVYYEFGGRRYSTQTAQPPGATIAVQVSAMGVMAPSAAPSAAPAPQDSSAPWQNVIPEAGMVVSGAGAVATPYPQTTYYAPSYPNEAPVYVAPYGYAPSFYPAPYYHAAPTYYGSPFYAAPIGLSLNLGYSRGWGRGHGRWR